MCDHIGAKILYEQKYLYSNKVFPGLDVMLGYPRTPTYPVGIKFRTTMGDGLKITKLLVWDTKQNWL
jgi:hypothetical protein